MALARMRRGDDGCGSRQRGGFLRSGKYFAVGRWCRSVEEMSCLHGLDVQQKEQVVINHLF